MLENEIMERNQTSTVSVPGAVCWVLVRCFVPGARAVRAVPAARSTKSPGTWHRTRHPAPSTKHARYTLLVVRFALGVHRLRPERELRGRQAPVPRAADGDPLRAPGDARGSQPSSGRSTPGACARRSTASRSDEVKRAKFDAGYEDLFFYVEGLLIQACGEDVAGRLHTARSRNDIDMTMAGCGSASSSCR